MAQRKVAAKDARKLGDCFPGDLIAMLGATWRVFTLGSGRGFVRTYDMDTKAYGECTVINSDQRCLVTQPFMPAAVEVEPETDPLLKVQDDTEELTLL